MHESIRTPDDFAQDIRLELRNWFSAWFPPKGPTEFQSELYEPLYQGEVSGDEFVSVALKYTHVYGPGDPLSELGVREAVAHCGLPVMAHIDRPQFGELIAACAYSTQATLCWSRGMADEAWNHVMQARWWTEQINQGEIYSQVLRAAPNISRGKLNEMFARNGAKARHRSTTEAREYVLQMWPQDRGEYPSKAEFAAEYQKILTMQGVKVSARTILNWLPTEKRAPRHR